MAVWEGDEVLRLNLRGELPGDHRSILGAGLRKSSIVWGRTSRKEHMLAEKGASKTQSIAERRARLIWSDALAGLKSSSSTLVLVVAFSVAGLSAALYGSHHVEASLSSRLLKAGLPPTDPIIENCLEQVGAIMRSFSLGLVLDFIVIAFVIDLLFTGVTMVGSALNATFIIRHPWALEFLAVRRDVMLATRPGLRAVVVTLCLVMSVWCFWAWRQPNLDNTLLPSLRTLTTSAALGVLGTKYFAERNAGLYKFFSGASGGRRALRVFLLGGLAHMITLLLLVMWVLSTIEDRWLVRIDRNIQATAQSLATVEESIVAAGRQEGSMENVFWKGALEKWRNGGVDTRYLPRVLDDARFVAVLVAAAWLVFHVVGPLGALGSGWTLRGVVALISAAIIVNVALEWMRLVWGFQWGELGWIIFATTVGFAVVESGSRMALQFGREKGRKCKNCNSKNSRQARFCSACGSFVMSGEKAFVMSHSPGRLHRFGCPAVRRIAGKNREGFTSIEEAKRTGVEQFCALCLPMRSRSVRCEPES